MFSATQLNQVTIFGLGIMPYISASIIFQLLGQRLSRRSNSCKRRAKAGRKKINEYTRYATVLLCLGQSWVYLRLSGQSERYGPRVSRRVPARCLWLATDRPS